MSEASKKLIIFIARFPYCTSVFLKITDFGTPRFTHLSDWSDSRWVKKSNFRLSFKIQFQPIFWGLWTLVSSFDKFRAVLSTLGRRKKNCPKKVGWATSPIVGFGPPKTPKNRKKYFVQKTPKSCLKVSQTSSWVVFTHITPIWVIPDHSWGASSTTQYGPIFPGQLP